MNDSKLKIHIQIIVVYRLINIQIVQNWVPVGVTKMHVHYSKQYGKFGSKYGRPLGNKGTLTFTSRKKFNQNYC